MILVTGITGLTGRFLYNEISQDGRLNQLRCLVRESSDTTWMADKPNLVVGDVASVSDLVSAMQGVSGVIHLYNIRHSPQIMEACQKAGVKRVVFVNTTGVYSKYQSYSALYQELERKIASSDLDWTIIRPTMIYGNHQDKNIHKLVKLLNRYSIFPVLGSGNALMQPIYAADLAKVIYQAYKIDDTIKQDYNVAGKEPLSYISLLKLIAADLGKEVTFFHVPYKLALIAGKIGELIPNGLINYEKVRRLSENKDFDYSKALQDIGYHPLSFGEGVKLEINALREKGII